MFSPRRHGPGRALSVIVALAFLSLLAFATRASAGVLGGMNPTAQVTPVAPQLHSGEQSDFGRLPPLFPGLRAMPEPPVGPPSIHTTENILVLGVDTREGGKMWRTDTIMVAAIDSARREVGIVSIPRDLWVNIPGYGDGRINIVDFIGESRSGTGGGPALVSEVLKENLGIETQHWVRIRQEGLVELVDAMGGITITLQCPFVEKTPDPAVRGQFQYLMLPAGPVFLDGETAKKFVTYRYASTDFSRAQRQQQVIWAIRDRALQVDLFPHIGQLWSALSDTFQTDLLAGDFVRLAMLGRDIDPTRVHGMVLSRTSLQSAAIDNAAVLLIADPEGVKQEVEGVFASRPIVMLGRMTTGRCASYATAAPGAIGGAP